MFLTAAHRKTLTHLLFILAICAPAQYVLAAEIRCVASVSRDALRSEYNDRLLAAKGGGYSEAAPKILTRLENPRDPTGSQPLCKSASLTGTIAAGDAAQVSAFLSENAYVQRLYLNAGGDDAAEGMKIGRAIRQASVATAAPLAADGDIQHAVLMRDDVTAMRNLCTAGGSCACTGACFYVWSGGTVREGNAVRLPDDGAKPDTAGRENYLAEMGISPSWAKEGGALHSALPNPLPPDLMYAPDMAKRISAQCGKTPTAADIPAGQRLAPGEAKATYKVQLGHMYEAWQACTELATAR